MPFPKALFKLGLAGVGFMDCDMDARHDREAGCGLAGVGFMDCDMVIIRDGYIRNVIIFENCHIIGGTIWNCNIYLPQEAFDRMKQDMPSLSSITYERP